MASLSIAGFLLMALGALCVVPLVPLAGGRCEPGAVAAAVCLFRYLPDNPFSIGVNVLVGVSLLIAAAVACACRPRTASRNVTGP